MERNSRRDESAAGRLKKVRGELKKVEGGLFEGRIAVEPPNPENPLSGLKKEHVGHFLINDVGRDLVQINRQSEGLERLQDLRSKFQQCARMDFQYFTGATWIERSSGS